MDDGKFTAIGVLLFRPSVSRDHAQAGVVGAGFDGAAAAGAAVQAPGHRRHRCASIQTRQQRRHGQNFVVAAGQAPGRHGNILARQIIQSWSGLVGHRIKFPKN